MEMDAGIDPVDHMLLMVGKILRLCHTKARPEKLGCLETRVLKVVMSKVCKETRKTFSQGQGILGDLLTSFSLLLSMMCKFQLS